MATRRSAAVGLLLALTGVTAMGVAGWLAVAGAERVMDLTGVGGSVVGLTAVALATTAEFVALIPAAVRRGIPESAAAGSSGRCCTTPPSRSAQRRLLGR